MKYGKDWFDFTSPEEREVLRKELLNGPKSLVRMGSFWGDGVNVICAGTEEQAQAVAARLHENKFHKKPCPMDKYPEGWGPIPTVAERLVKCERHHTSDLGKISEAPK